MTHSTSNTYSLKRKILNFTNKVSKNLSKADRKFTADITYGMLSSGSCLLTDICDRLHEHSKKVNVVDRLSRHLEKGTPAASAYLQLLKLPFSNIQKFSRLVRWENILVSDEPRPLYHALMIVLSCVASFEFLNYCLMVS